MGVPDGRQRCNCERRHDQCHRLVADGEAEAEQGAGDPAGAPIVPAAGKEEEPGDRAQDLRVVMVDAARTELRQGRCRGDHEEEHEGRGQRPGAPLRLARDDEGQREEQQRRPDDAGRQLRPIAAQQGRKGTDQRGERRIDQPRPVREERLGRADAGERGVEPGRAGEELAHGDEPHRVVRVAEPIGERRPRAGQRGDDKEGGGEQGPGERRGGPSAEHGQPRQQDLLRNQHRHRRCPKRNGAVTLRDAP